MAVYIGIRIGEQIVEGIAVRPGAGKMEVVGRSSARYADDRSLAHALAECARSFSEHSAEWTVGLPGGEFSFRHLAFPFAKHSAIASAVPFEMEALTPYDATDLDCSFRTLSDASSGAKVLACAIPKERMARYRNAIEEAGIAPAIVMPDVCALDDFYRGVLRNAVAEYDRLPVLLAHADESALSLCYAGRDGFLDVYSTPPEEGAAERFIEACGDRPEKTYADGDRAHLFPALSGERLWREEVDDWFGGGNAARDMLTVGLAVAGSMRGDGRINFSDRKSATEKLYAAYRFAAIGAVCCLALWVGFLGYGNHVKENALEKTKAAITRVFTTALPGVRVVKPTAQLRQHLQELQERLRIAGISGSDRVDFLWMLKLVSQKIPASVDVELDEVQYDEKGMTLYGTADGFDTVNRIRDRLAAAPSFKGVTVTESRTATDSTQVKFRIQISL